MKIIKQILLSLFLIMVIIIGGLSFYIRQNGKELIETKLSQALKRQVVVGQAQVIFPLGLRFDRVEIHDALTARTLRVKFGIPLFLAGQFNISKVRLTQPIFWITRTLDKKIIWGKKPIGSENILSSSSTALGESMVPSTSQTASHKGILIDYLEVEDGQVVFRDEVSNSAVNIEQVNLKAVNIPLPARNINTRFNLSALIRQEDVPFAGHKIDARGMINLTLRNMDVSLKLLDQDNKDSFASSLKSINNHLVIAGKINITRFVTGIRTKSSKESAWEGVLSHALETSGVEFGVDYKCETKMDDPQCGSDILVGKFINQKDSALK